MLSTSYKFTKRDISCNCADTKQRFNYVKAIYLGSTIQGKFMGSSYLGKVISGELFCVAIAWEPIVQWLIICSGAITKEAILLFFGRRIIWEGENFPGRQ